MSKKRCTIIYFDYGGYYSKNEDNVDWIAREDVVYAVMMKTSKENVTYSKLIDEIYKKITVDKSMTKLKLSYIPMANLLKRPSYIKNDEDVYVYLMTEVKDKSFLYVELIAEVGQNMGGEREIEDGLTNEEKEKNLGFERHSDIGLTNEDLVSSGRDHDIILTEPLDGVDVSLEGGEDVEVTANVEGGELVNEEWEDGTNMTLGQIFENKRAVQDLIDITSLQSCFEFDVIKTDTKLYVVKCSEAKRGCKWSVRTAKDKNSNCFSVRTYNKMHTCSRVSTSTRRNRRKGTPRIVESILRDDYAGQFDTLTPKSIIDMVQNKFGVKVSYSTAWRGRKQVQDVRSNPNEN